MHYNWLKMGDDGQIWCKKVHLIRSAKLLGERNYENLDKDKGIITIYSKKEKV